MKKETHNPTLAALARQLPTKLRWRFREDIILTAIEENIIALSEDGHLVWLLENKTLLAYFCGRMWCGDKVVYDRVTRKHLWIKGDVRFPCKDLEVLFGVENLKQLRFQRFFCSIPENIELIDNLFVSN